MSLRCACHLVSGALHDQALQVLHTEPRIDPDEYEVRRSADMPIGVRDVESFTAS